MSARVEKLTETDLEELAYHVENAREIVELKALKEREERRIWNEHHPDCLPTPETSCLWMAQEILEKVVSRLQAARDR